MDVIQTAIKGFKNFSGIYNFTLGNAVMLVVACVLMYLAIAKDFEPILLLPIAFGCFLANIPAARGAFYSINPEYVRDLTGTVKPTALLDFFYFLVKSEILPPLIFLGIGAMTDFGPLLANPVSLLLGAAAQVGVFVAMVVAHHDNARQKQRADVQVYLVEMNAASLSHNAIENRVAHANGFNLFEIFGWDECSI